VYQTWCFVIVLIHINAFSIKIVSFGILSISGRSFERFSQRRQGIDWIKLEASFVCNYYCGVCNSYLCCVKFPVREVATRTLGKILCFELQPEAGTLQLVQLLILALRDDSSEVRRRSLSCIKAAAKVLSLEPLYLNVRGILIHGDMVVI
jgi:hypothetical protein